MEIQIEKLEKLVKDADKIVLSQEAEETLIQILQIQEQVEHAVKEAKERIEKRALALNPNLQSIVGERVKVYYRAYGSRYSVDLAYLDKLPASLYKVRKTYDVIADEVDRFVDEHGGLPLGIKENERNKSLSFSLKNKTEENE